MASSSDVVRTDVLSMFIQLIVLPIRSVKHVDIIEEEKDAVHGDFSIYSKVKMCLF